jgi:hypothetical protein
MQKVPRVLAMLASGGVIVASNVLSYLSAPRGSFGVVDLLHFSLPLTIYVFANLCMDEGRARERADRDQRGQ